MNEKVNQPMLGKKHSNETKTKISETVKKYKLTDEQMKNHQIGIDNYRNSNEYIPPMLGKKHSEETKKLLSIKGIQSNKLKIENFKNRLINHLKQFDIEIIEFGTPIIVKCNKCETIFTRTKSVFTVYNYSKYNGKYCPCCNPPLYNGYWDLEDFEKYPEEKERKGRFYIIELFNESEKFIKIGITTRTIKLRYKGLKNYKYKIILDKEDTIYNAFILEQKLLKNKQMKYIPLQKFGGKYECFKIEYLPQLLNSI